jgi:transcriptional regulator with XRE-family HTH domain
VKSRLPGPAENAKKELGARLREVRKDADLSGRALAERTKQHFTRVSKIENGTQLPTDEDIRAWCAACGAGDRVPGLIAEARNVAHAYLEFKQQARAGLKKVTGPHTLERYGATTAFRIYEHNAVPGLFQTPAYIEAMLSFWMRFLSVTGDVAQAVEDRLRKQEIVGWPGKTFTAIVEEQALRTWFGCAEVHAAQLGRLLEVMGNPAVTLGIVPLMTERTGVPSAPFWIFDEELVALETPTASIQVTRPEEVKLYLRMFAHAAEAAVFGAQARALIVKALDDMP